MGQLGISPSVFSGCNCKYCKGKNRVESLMDFLSEMSDLVHMGKMEFGTNSYDPKLDLKELIGVDLKKLEKIQDYILFENHSLPSLKRNNLYINKISKEIIKPTFVLSYRDGVGMENEFSQRDFDNIYTEASRLNFYPCFKGSEFTSNNTWHNLYIEKYNKLKINKDFKEVETKQKTSSLKIFNLPIAKWILKNYYNSFQTLFFENYFVPKLFIGAYWLALHK